MFHSALGDARPAVDAAPAFSTTDSSDSAPRAVHNPALGFYFQYNYNQLMEILEGSIADPSFTSKYVSFIAIYSIANAVLGMLCLSSIMEG